MGKFGKIIATATFALSVVLCGCAQPGPQSAVEVYDKFVEGAYDNYKLSGTIAMDASGEVSSSFEPGEGVEVVDSTGTDTSFSMNMAYDVNLDAEVTKKTTHALMDVSLDFSGFSMNMNGDIYVDADSKIAYTKMDMPVLSLLGGETEPAQWTASTIDELVSDDAVKNMRTAFEKAKFEESDGKYTITMTLADILDTAALDEEQADSLAQGFGSDTEMLSKIQLVYTFDKDCKLTALDIPEYKGESNGVATVVSGQFKFSDYGQVGEIVIPDEAKQAEVTYDSDLSSILNPEYEGGTGIDTTEPLDLGTEVVSDIELNIDDKDVATDDANVSSVNDVKETTVAG